MKVYLISLLLGITMVLAFFSLGLGDGVVGGIKVSSGFLTVESIPEGELVSIGTEIIGKTPIEKWPVEVGLRKVKIGSYWEEKITISDGLETKIWQDVRNSDQGFSYGHKIESEIVGAYVFKEREMIVGVNPVDSKVELDYIEKPNGSQTIKKLDEQEHFLKISADGYDSQEFFVSTPLDTVTSVEVLLRPDPFQKAQHITIFEVDGNIDITTVRPVFERLDWQGERLFGGEYDLQVVPWSKIEIWGIHLPASIGSIEFIKELDSIYSFLLDQENGKEEEIKALPFAYVIDEEGQIFEGIGIFDFDFSMFRGQDQFENSNLDRLFAEGIAPVLVLSSKGLFIEDNGQVLSSLVYLQQMIKNGPQLEVELVTEVDTLEFSFGEDRVVSFQWRNLSPVVLQKGNHDIVLTKKDGSDSRYYDSLTWENTNTVGGFDESRVYPGQIISFRLPIHTGYYPELLEEEFILRDIKKNENIQGSDFRVAVNILSETDKKLEVVNTQTGASNVRSGPNLGNNLISAVYTGERFAWTEIDNGWVEIILSDGQKGWILDKHTRKID